MERYPQILNVIQKGYLNKSHEVLEERKLELKLGPPGENNSFLSPHKRGFQEITVDGKTGEANWVKNSIINEQLNQENKKLSFSEKPNRKECFLAVMVEHSSQPCNFSREKIQCPEQNTGSTPPNTHHKRIAPGPVVGWPPVRSFRKNITNNDSTSKVTGPESWRTEKNIRIKEEIDHKKGENAENNLFVKINMDGIPIGRKIDLKAYDSYAKLSSAVDQLFSGLLAAQGGDKMKVVKEGGLINGRGEFSLVYEDNEGDRMLVGDVPWKMFVSSAKRLRVLKISELSALRISNSKLARTPLDSAAEDPTV